MKVSIKDFPVSMEIKSKGIELDVYSNDGTHKGDLIVRKTGLIWCKGQTSPQKGVKVSWEAFIDYMES